MAHRRCTRCRKLYPLTRTYFYSSGPRLRRECKTCYDQTDKEYQARRAEGKPASNERRSSRREF